MAQQTIKKNQVVWAKLKGFPWWPSCVESVGGTNAMVNFLGEYSQQSANCQKYLKQYVLLDEFDISATINTEFIHDFKENYDQYIKKVNNRNKKLNLAVDIALRISNGTSTYECTAFKIRVFQSIKSQEGLQHQIEGRDLLLHFNFILIFRLVYLTEERDLVERKFQMGEEDNDEFDEKEDNDEDVKDDTKGKKQQKTQVNHNNNDEQKKDNQESKRITKSTQKTKDVKESQQSPASKKKITEQSSSTLAETKIGKGPSSRKANKINEKQHKKGLVDEEKESSGKQEKEEQEDVHFLDPSFLPGNDSSDIVSQERQQQLAQAIRPKNESHRNNRSAASTAATDEVAVIASSTSSAKQPQPLILTTNNSRSSKRRHANNTTTTTTTINTATSLIPSTAKNTRNSSAATGAQSVQQAGEQPPLKKRSKAGEGLNQQQYQQIQLPLIPPSFNKFHNHFFYSSPCNATELKSSVEVIIQTLIDPDALLHFNINAPNELEKMCDRFNALNLSSIDILDSNIGKTFMQAVGLAKQQSLRNELIRKLELVVRKVKEQVLDDALGKDYYQDLTQTISKNNAQTNSSNASTTIATATATNTANGKNSNANHTATAASLDDSSQQAQQLNNGHKDNHNNHNANSSSNAVINQPVVIPSSQIEIEQEDEEQQSNGTPHSKGQLILDIHSAALSSTKPSSSQHLSEKDLEKQLCDQQLRKKICKKINELLKTTYGLEKVHALDLCRRIEKKIKSAQPDVGTGYKNTVKGIINLLKAKEVTVEQLESESSELFAIIEQKLSAQDPNRNANESKQEIQQFNDESSNVNQNTAE